MSRSKPIHLAKPDRRSRAAWRALVTRWRDSQRTAVDFGATENVDPQQLRWWAWKLGIPAGTPSDVSLSPSSASVGFIELPMLETTLELQIRNHALRFPASIAPAQLSAIIRAIEVAS